jgi:hypothetical protein
MDEYYNNSSYLHSILVHSLITKQAVLAVNMCSGGVQFGLPSGHGLSQHVPRGSHQTLQANADNT